MSLRRERRFLSQHFNAGVQAVCRYDQRQQKAAEEAYHATDEGRCCGCRAAADTVFSKIAMHLSFEP